MSTPNAAPSEKLAARVGRWRPVPVPAVGELVIDKPSLVTSVPSRLGVTGRFEDGALTLDIEPRPSATRTNATFADLLVEQISYCDPSR